MLRKALLPPAHAARLFYRICHRGWPISDAIERAPGDGEVPFVDNPKVPNRRLDPSVREVPEPRRETCAALAEVGAAVIMPGVVAELAR